MIKDLFNKTKNLKVLYVEDDLELQKRTTLMLKELFSEIYVCNNGVDAFKLYFENYIDNCSYYDLVLTDVTMPHLDGLELSKKIKSIDEKQKIVVTSAHNDSEKLIDFINLGINKFIKKHINLNN